MDQFDVGVAAHFAEYGGTLDRFVTDAVEFAEECGATDIGQEKSPECS
jgi:hypothetical protein